jgi:nickel transport protein
LNLLLFPTIAMRRSTFALLFGAAGLALAPLAAGAHSIQTDLHLLGGAHGAQLQASLPISSGRMELQSAFSNGQPARDAAVRLIPAQGATPIELGRTDAQGRLAFALPERTGRDAEIQVDAGPGHRDWIELSELGAGRRQASLPLRGVLLSLAPVAALGLLGGLARLQRPRG